MAPSSSSAVWALRLEKQKRLRRTAGRAVAVRAASRGKSCRRGLESEDRARLAARFLAAAEENTALVKCLARTAARSQIAEQRLMEMKLLHQSIEHQHKQLCMTVALLKNSLASEPVARQHEG